MPWRGSRLAPRTAHTTNPAPVIVPSHPRIDEGWMHTPMAAPTCTSRRHQPTRPPPSTPSRHQPGMRAVRPSTLESPTALRPQTSRVCRRQPVLFHVKPSASYQRQTRVMSRHHPTSRRTDTMVGPRFHVKHQREPGPRATRTSRRSKRGTAARREGSAPAWRRQRQSTRRRQRRAPTCRHRRTLPCLAVRRPHPNPPQSGPSGYPRRRDGPTSLRPSDTSMHQRPSPTSSGAQHS